MEHGGEGGAAVRRGSGKVERWLHTKHYTRMRWAELRVDLGSDLAQYSEKVRSSHVLCSIIYDILCSMYVMHLVHIGNNCYLDLNYNWSERSLFLVFDNKRTVSRDIEDPKLCTLYFMAFGCNANINPKTKLYSMYSLRYVDQCLLLGFFR